MARLKNKANSVADVMQEENRKRKREIALIFLISILLVVLVAIEIYVFRTGQSLPSPYVVYFIGLVNINLILVLYLLLLIFRNVIKIFLERKSKFYGSSLKSKLTLAFSTFSVIPTVLVLVISLFYLNSSFEKWFSQRMVNVLRNASTVVDAFLNQEKKNAYNYGKLIAQQLPRNTRALGDFLKQVQMNYQLDAVEYYPNFIDTHTVVQDFSKLKAPISTLNSETLQKSILFKANVSSIHVFADGHLLRAVTPVLSGPSGAIVVSKYLELPPHVKINDLVGARQEFQNNLSIQDPIRSIYFVMLILLSLVVLFAAVWYGFHLSKQLTVPLVQLGRATKRVAGGDYTPLDIDSGSDEINSLIQNFNQMAGNLSASEIELQQTLKDLHQYTAYVEIVLANVNAGVISLDNEGKIRTINRKAKHLLKIENIDAIGKHLHNLLSTENYQTFFSIFKIMSVNGVSSIQKEARIIVEDEHIPLSIHVSILKNELQEEIGRIVVFDDMTAIVNAQRSAAWSEVARRIAHEIKNPLTPIRLAAERIHRKYSQKVSEKTFDDSIQMIVSQVDEMKNLVNEFSQFARMPQLKKVMGQINEVVKETVAIYAENNPEVKFEVELDTQMPMFKFDFQQMKRVLINLVDNSVMALEDHKQPVISIKTVFLANYSICKIFVADNEAGIPAIERQKVFEPYFSTKEKGTGLGLAIVKSIIEDHDGVIRALPNEPTGTKMYIEIPTKG